jgi:hypothetical protein
VIQSISGPIVSNGIDVTRKRKETKIENQRDYACGRQIEKNELIAWLASVYYFPSDPDARGGKCLSHGRN